MNKLSQENMRRESREKASLKTSKKNQELQSKNLAGPIPCATGGYLGMCGFKQVR